jgi:hypothetical protein
MTGEGGAPDLSFGRSPLPPGRDEGCSYNVLALQEDSYYAALLDSMGAEAGMDGTDESKAEPEAEPEAEREGGPGGGDGGGGGEAGASPSPPGGGRRRRRRLFDARAQAAAVKALAGGATFAEAAAAAGFAVSTLHSARQRDADFDEACAIAVEESDGEVLIAPHKGRKLQFRRVRRQLFGPNLQDLFLEHFAATCSIAAAAEAAGVGRSTVNKHLAEDEDFKARFDRTVEIAYRQLDAELVGRRLEAAQRAQIDGGEPDDPAEFDRALQLLREHKRGRAAEPERRGRQPTVASNEEVRAALVKALAAFGIRVRAGEQRGAGGRWIPDPARDDDPAP